MNVLICFDNSKGMSALRDMYAKSLTFLSTYAEMWSFPVMIDVKFPIINE